MTAPAKTPARRLLATYPTHAEAANAAVLWQRMEHADADVAVEHRCRGTTAERPWGVTANRGGGGS